MIDAIVSYFVPGGVTAGLLIIFAFLSRNWVATRISESIKHEYARALEVQKNKFQLQTEQRREAAKFAELVSLWLRAKTDDDILEVQRKYWELALWLEPEVLRLVGRAFENVKPGQGHFDALAAVRRVIRGADDDFRPEEFIRWDQKANAPPTT